MRRGSGYIVFAGIVGVLALILGILVGGTIVDRTGNAGAGGTAAAPDSEMRARLASADEFDSGIAGRVVAGGLDGRGILMLTTPDADSASVDAVSRLITEAGGTIEGRIALTPKFVDGNADAELRTVVTSSLPAGTKLRTDSVDPGTLVGDLLGAGFMLPEDGRPRVDAEGRALIAGALADSGFIGYERGTLKPGRVAVLVTGAEDNDRGARSVVLGRLAEALSVRGGGAVLAGPAFEEGGDGPIPAVRADEKLSASVATVDGVDTVRGRINTVLALSRLFGAGPGAYGTSPGAAAVVVPR